MNTKWVLVEVEVDHPRPMTVVTAQSHERRSSYEGSSVAASQSQRVRASEETETMVESSDLLLRALERTTSLQKRLMRHHDCLRPCNGIQISLFSFFGRECRPGPQDVRLAERWGLPSQEPLRCRCQ